VRVLRPRGRPRVRNSGSSPVHLRCPQAQRVVEFTAMNRRDFIRLSAAASVAVFRRPLSFGEIIPNPSVRLTLRADRLGNKIDDDFTGLSYESAQLGGMVVPRAAQR
jgi:hypothetical protein